MEDYPGSMADNNVATENHPGATGDHPGAMEDHPGEL